MPDEQRRATESGRHRVAVAQEGHAGIVGDDAGDLGGGRERCAREGEQRLGIGQLADGRSLTTRSSAFTVVTGGGAEHVEGALGLFGRGRSHGAPPATRDEAHRGLDGALAIPAPGRTGFDDGAVVLGHRSERGLDVLGPRHDHRGQAVGPPHPRRPAQAPQHLVDGLDEVGLVHLFGQHAAHLARVRQRAQQHVGRRSPRRVAPLEPVPLDLLARRMIDLDGVASLDPRAGLAVRPESGQAHLAGKGWVAQGIAQPPDLVIESGRPHVRVVDEPGRQVREERLERVGRRLGPDAGDPLPVDVGPDGLSVPAQVPGDRRDRPAPVPQCMCFHVFPMCEHAERVSLRAGWLGRSSASKGAHRRGWMVQLTGSRWGISVIEGGEIQKSRTDQLVVFGARHCGWLTMRRTSWRPTFSLLTAFA